MTLNKDFFIDVHPGSVLQMMLDDAGMTQLALAKHIHVSQARVNEICRGKRGVTAEMAIRLGKAFGQSPQFWLGLQNEWECAQIDKSKVKGINQLKQFAEENKLAA